MQEPIEQLLGVKLTSLIDATVAGIRGQSLACVGLIASPTTIRKGLFVNELQNIGVKTVTMSHGDIDAVEDLIRDCIAGNAPSEAKLKTHIDGLVKRGAERVILGCTELSVIGSSIGNDSVIDPLKLVVSKIFNKMEKQNEK